MYPTNENAIRKVFYVENLFVNPQPPYKSGILVKHLESIASTELLKAHKDNSRNSKPLASKIMESRTI